jgi:hypothetical protein
MPSAAASCRILTTNAASVPASQRPSSRATLFADGISSICRAWYSVICSPLVTFMTDSPSLIPLV